MILATIGMSAIRRLLARVAGLWRSQAPADDELRAELQAHLDMAIEENIRRGLHPDEARRQALIASGGLTQAVEIVRAQRTLPWLETLAADVRYAARHFRRTPLSAITMVLVLSLGVGINVLLFTVLNSAATMPPPGVRRDAALVRIRGLMQLPDDNPQTRPLSWPEVQEYAGRTDLFSSVAAYAEEAGTLGGVGTDTPDLSVNLIFATADYYRLLDVRPVLGLWPSAPPGAMIGYALWQRRFGGARDVIGRSLPINGVAVQVVGVAPAGFAGTDGRGGPAVWLPLSAYPVIQKRTPAIFESRDSLFFSASARLCPGVRVRDASLAVAGMAARARHRSADVAPLLASNNRLGDRRDAVVNGVAALTFALLALLITCTNVSALMVGLAVARRREIGVRLSLGAPRSRLIRQLLTESVLLALAAAAVGLLATAAGIRVLGASLEGVQLAIDWRVTLATCAVAVASGILFGLSPALHATRVSVSDVLKSAASSVAATRSRLQRALVVAQIALTQPMLVGLGVVVFTMVTDLGSRASSGAPERMAEIELDTWAGRVSNEERASRIAAIVERVAALPGVVAAMPLQMGTTTVPLAVHPADRLPGRPPGPVMMTNLVAAPKGWFQAFDIAVTRGRGFAAAEHARASSDTTIAGTFDAVIIAGDLAHRLWGDADPVGRRLVRVSADSSVGPPMVIVGVVDERSAGPSEVNDRFRVYTPYATLYTGVVVRTAGPALPMLDALRRIAQSEAPQLPIARAQTLAQRDAAFRRTLLRTSGAVAAGGLLALLLSAIGLYAVVALAVGQRTREIGIRRALGAPRGQVVRLFFVRGIALSVLGLALGLPLSMVVTRLVARALQWPLAGSPLLGVAIGMVVLGVASAAVWIPARRASTIDPMLAIRSD